MPVKTEDGGDESNREGFEEQSGEHEEHGGDKWNDGAKLRRPVLVEWNAKNGSKREKGPEGWLETGVPCRREVAQVIDGDVRYGDEAKSAALRRRPPHLVVLPLPLRTVKGRE